MMQGDSYGLPVELKTVGEKAITPDDVSDIEITVGYLTKRYSSGDVWFDYDSGTWIFPLSQEETFAYPASRVKAQARVAWKDGGVNGVELGRINVAESISREVV